MSLITMIRCFRYMSGNSIPRRVFNLGGKKITALYGKTARGVSWTKLYSESGDLISWKSSANGKIKKVKYMQTDTFVRKENAFSQTINKNKKTAIIKFNNQDNSFPKPNSSKKETDYPKKFKTDYDDYMNDPYYDPMKDFCDEDFFNPFGFDPFSRKF